MGKEEGTVRLYDLVNEYHFALENLDTDDDILFNDTMEALQGDIEHKLANMGAYILNIKAERDAIKEAADKMAARHKALTKRSKSVV